MQIITPQQCKAARALLGWSQVVLSKQAGVSLSAIRSFERYVSEPRHGTRALIIMAFEKNNIQFIHKDTNNKHILGVECHHHYKSFE